MIKFLADESVDFRIVQSLRSNGYKVQAIIEFSAGAIDIEVLKIANEAKAILITEDKDFGELTFRLRRTNYGIILLRMSGMKTNEKVEKILKVFNDHVLELSNRFTVITYNKLRIREIKD